MAAPAIPTRPTTSCARATAPGRKPSRPASPWFATPSCRSATCADPWGDYQKDIADKHELIAANPDRLILVRSAADILTAKREKKFGVVLGTQDTSMVGPSSTGWREMKKDGVMTVQLTYNNRATSPATGRWSRATRGLSKLGKATIERIEAEKLLLDLSHGGARTMAEATAFAKRPLVISHTGARALTEHPRNTSDATIKAVADKGGVVGVYFMPFLTPDSHPEAARRHRARRACRQCRGRGPCRDRHRQWRAAARRSTPKRRSKLDEWQRERIKLGIAAPGEAVGRLSDGRRL